MKTERGLQRPRKPQDEAGIVRRIDLRRAKAEALRILSAGHPVREALVLEPDFLPRPEGLAKIEVFIRVLFALRRRT